MTHFTTGLLTLALLSQSFISFAGDQPEKPKDIVTLVGELNPKFSVELSPDDIQSLIDSVKEFTELKPKQVDINSLYRPGDEDAIAQARQTIAKMFLDSALDIVNMKALLYKLAALLKAQSTERFTTQLYKVYQGKFQESYSSLIRRVGFLNDDILASVEQCKSEICVTTIGNAQAELVSFAHELNQGIYLKNFNKVKTNWTFKDPMLRATLETTLDAFLSPNHPSNLYGSIVLAALTPFVAAARATAHIGTSILGFIATPTMTRLTIHADPIDLGSANKELVRKLGSLVERKLQRIVNSKDGVTTSQPDPSSQNVDRKNDPDFNGAEPHRVSVLVCDIVNGKFENGDDIMAGHFGVFGFFHFKCYNGRHGDSNTYAVTLTTIGPGLGIYEQKFGSNFHLATITITSPTPIVPIGRWYGVSAGADGVFGPGQAGQFVGKWGSVAHFAAYTFGLGAHVGISKLQIKLMNN